MSTVSPVVLYEICKELQIGLFVTANIFKLTFVVLAQYVSVSGPLFCFPAMKRYMLGGKMSHGFYYKFNSL